MSVIIGTSADDSLIGTGADDQIDGLGGNDFLNGGGGTDLLNGGAGNDTFLVDSADDQVIEAEGGGNDALYTLASYTLSADAEIEVLSIFDRTTVSALSLLGNRRSQTIIGNAGNNLLNGGGGADVLYGLGGNDTYLVDSLDDQVVEAAGQGNDAVYAAANYVLAAGAEIEVLSAFGQTSTSALQLVGNSFSQAIIGNAGANLLNGGGGADILYGLGGDDNYLVDSLDDQVVESAGQGNDTVYAAASYVLTTGAEVEALSVFGQASTSAIELTGNAFSQAIIGNAGANLLNGGGGADVLYGLGGNDTYLVDSLDDLVIEAATQGNDVVYASASYVLAAGSEVEVLSAFGQSLTGALDLTGNALSQALIGNAGANLLNGGGGADVLYGLGGNDTYLVDSLSDLVAEAIGQGNDAVYAAASYVLAPGAEIEVLSAFGQTLAGALELTGNGLSQIIIGNAGSNLLNGGGGADVLSGLGGNDTYLVDSFDDQVLEAAALGNDVVYAAASYALTAGAEVETLAAFGQASAGALDLTGNSLSQVIVGNAGSNLLNGGGGADVLHGLAGNDTYVVDSLDDLVVEDIGGGKDTVYAAASYALGQLAEVEVLSAFGQGLSIAMNLTGSALAQTIIGNAGANVLDGAFGMDTLYGLGGADSFAFTTALDVGNIDIIADFTAGTDKILLGGNFSQPFALLASGALSGAAFLVGNGALETDDIIIYNSATGALLYDADGSGGGTAIQFATVSPGLALSAADFLVSGPANTAPIITSPTTATIAENSPATTIVYQAIASDADGDRITYALGGTDASFFLIDATGAVRLKQPADFEIRTSYSFSVIASDSGPNAAVRNVVLTVSNVDESTPIINETSAVNDSIAAAQIVDRSLLAVRTNPNLPNDDLPSVTVQGSISAVSDKDFFAITLQAGELLVLDVDNSGGNLDSMVRVFNAAGVEVAANDDLITLDPGSPAHPEYGHNTDSFVRYRAPSAGTYYFSIESLQDAQNPTLGSYDLHVGVGPPATAAELLSEDIDALISGDKWSTTALTYAFPTSVSQYPADIDETDPVTDFAPFTAVQQQATTQLLQLVANVSQLTFQAAANPANAHLKFAMSSEADIAYAYFPPFGSPTPGSSLAGTAWFNKQDFNNPVKGNYAWAAILHETGHTLGLKHGHESPAVSRDRDSLEYTVMTYRSYVDGNDDGYSNETWGYPQTLMMLDIAALQRIYGANFNYNSGNSIYSWSPTTGEFFIDGAGQGAAGANRVFMTLWDGGGIDTYNFSNYGLDLIMDLRPGEWTSLGGAQLANLGDNRFARGNVANALTVDGDTRSLIENAIGGSGQDLLVANQAANRLTGNASADTFQWRSGSDAGVGPLADTITDFVRGADRINFEPLDAIPATGASDNFSFIGTAAFHNVAGELRYQAEGSNLRIQADLDGNGVADMEIIVNNNTILTALDFVF